MASRIDSHALDEFNEHLSELSETWYDGDQPEAFRHAAFQILAPDPTLSDEQVIEVTAIDHSGDLEVDGWFVDEQAETVFLFQAAGGRTQVSESKVAKFWTAPEELLNSQRVSSTPNESVKELSEQLNARLAEEYSISMVFASRSGFVPAARSFAASRRSRERVLTLLTGVEQVCRCTFELCDLANVAEAFNDFRSGFRAGRTDVELRIDGDWTYVVDQPDRRSIRATVPASEIVRVFNDNGYKLFDLNPRGPIANAKVNRNISKTLDTLEGRSDFHLLNNGMCATCDDFELNEDGSVSVTNFQIVNGCQTTVTLSKRTREELTQTHVDLKLVVAEAEFAQRIAESSNAQTALRAKDFTSFERQQRLLQIDFESLLPPWFYEIKQGYWHFVLSDRDKARFKTGPRKRHIEVQPLAQASLAFLGFPSVALDRVRYVFQGIRSREEREWYERAFPYNVKAEQLILPWTLLQYTLRQDSETRPRFANFHILWLIAKLLRGHYGVDGDQYFSSDLSLRLVNSIDDWLPDRYRIANLACRQAFRRARAITGDELDLRDFFRGTGDYGGEDSAGLIWEACGQELEFALDRGHDLPNQLPS